MFNFSFLGFEFPHSYLVNVSTVSCCCSSSSPHCVGLLWLAVVAFPMSDHRPQATERWLSNLDVKISLTRVSEWTSSWVLAKSYKKIYVEVRLMLPQSCCKSQIRLSSGCLKGRELLWIWCGCVFMNKKFQTYYRGRNLDVLREMGNRI